MAQRGGVGTTILGVLLAAGTLATLEEDELTTEVGPVTVDGFVVGVCAGVFLAAYGLTGTMLGAFGVGTGDDAGGGADTDTTEAEQPAD